MDVSNHYEWKFSKLFKDILKKKSKFLLFHILVFGTGHGYWYLVLDMDISANLAMPKNKKVLKRQFIRHHIIFIGTGGHFKS